MTGSDPEVDIAHVIKDVRFVRRDEMVGMTIYPAELKSTLWDDLANGFSQTRYLGVQRSESRAYLDSRVEPD